MTNVSDNISRFHALRAPRYALWRFNCLAIDPVTQAPNLVWLAITSPIRSRTHHREIENLANVVARYGSVFLVGG